MRNFVIQRLAALIPTLLGVSVIVFLVIHLIPGDTITAMIGTQYKLTEVQAASLRAYFGLDKPLWEQYLRWILAAVRGDLGYSVRSGQSVMSEILRSFPVTLELALFSMVIALTLGLPIGILSAVRRDTPVDFFGRLFALVGLALPNFWLGTLIILVLSVVFGIMPNSGRLRQFHRSAAEKPLAALFPGDHARLRLHGVDHAHDTLGHAGGVAAGLRAHGTRQRRAANAT